MYVYASSNTPINEQNEIISTTAPAEALLLNDGNEEELKEEINITLTNEETDGNFQPDMNTFILHGSAMN